jgi:hypothetical protein
VAEHTPGPWSVGHTRQSPTDPRIGPFWETAIHVGESRNRGNALALACLGGKGATNGSREAVEANARLIAAAPELLAACEAAKEWLEDETFNDLDELSDDCKELLETMRNVVKLAKEGDQ